MPVKNSSGMLVPTLAQLSSKIMSSIVMQWAR
jgi:hypothetical protein